MYQLLILTTAINRYDIHKHTLLPIAKLLKKNRIKTKWIINLDIIEKVNVNREETILFLTNKLKYSNIDIELTIKDKPCFYQAVKTLTIESEKYIDEIKCVLYLEDDWLLLEKDYTNFINKILHWKSNTIINMGKLSPCLLGFKPTLWCNVAFKEYFIKIFKENPIIIMDPEKYFRIHLYKGNVFRLPDINHLRIEKVYFIDYGRKWTKENKLNKNGWDDVQQSITY